LPNTFWASDSNLEAALNFDANLSEKDLPLIMGPNGPVDAVQILNLFRAGGRQALQGKMLGMEAPSQRKQTAIVEKSSTLYELSCGLTIVTGYFFLISLPHGY